MIVGKLRGARERVRARGERCEGQKPFGHYDGEPAILARIRQLRSEGLTYRNVAHQMNVEGLPTGSARIAEKALARAEFNQVQELSEFNSECLRQGEGIYRRDQLCTNPTRQATGDSFPGLNV